MKNSRYLEEIFDYLISLFSPFGCFSRKWRAAVQERGGVADAHRDWYMRVLDRERGRRFLPLIIVAVCLEIVQDRVQVAFYFGLR